MSAFCRTQADVEHGTISELIYDSARLPSMMASGDVHQMSSTISDPFRASSQSSHIRNDSTAPPSQTSNTRSRLSSQPTPPVNGRSMPHDDGPHIHWRGAPEHPQPLQNPNAGDHLVPRDTPSEAIPPPSPRLEPTHRSTLSLNGSTANSPSRIKVRDLAHIQSFASEEVLTRSRHPSRHSLRGRMDGGQHYEISAMPVTDVIEMVAGLLSKIITTNDRQHEYLHRSIPPPEGTTGLSPQATSVLAFHGKNVPSITIASYLSRIHKYCPTTYEVFLSLLIYFDRMAEMVNSGALPGYPGDGRHGMNHSRVPSGVSSDGSSETAVDSSPSGAEAESSPRAPPAIVSPPGSDSSDSQDSPMEPSPSLPSELPDSDAYDLSHYFVVDSFNIHRLVIAGVTCASKFFSDVFYTNSRYAKVGGLPLNELNHLELQFLLLNDFRLSVPIVELEAYGTMLVEFYAREVISQQQQATHMEGLYMQTQTPTPPPP
ncbi:cyclin-domain-containing protein [Usnea florida]